MRVPPLGAREAVQCVRARRGRRGARSARRHRRHAQRALGDVVRARTLLGTRPSRSRRLIAGRLRRVYWDTAEPRRLRAAGPGARAARSRYRVRRRRRRRTRARIRRAVDAIPALPRVRVRVGVPPDPDAAVRRRGCSTRSGATSGSARSSSRSRHDAPMRSSARWLAAYPQEEAIPAELVLRGRHRLARRCCCTRSARRSQTSDARPVRRRAARFGAARADCLGRRRAARLAATARLARGRARERRLRGGQIPGFEPTPVIVKRAAARAGASTPYG